MAKKEINLNPALPKYAQMLNDMSISDLESLVSVCDDISLNEENDAVGDLFFNVLNDAMVVLKKRRQEEKEKDNVK